MRTEAILLLAAVALGPAVACGGAVAPDESRGHTETETVESGRGSTSGATDPRCLPQGGYVDDPCDLCENAACCEERFDCYDDASCGAAADALEQCAAATSGAAAASVSCWGTFERSSALAASRVACQRTHCPHECGVPN